jgi:hypothetical protein
MILPISASQIGRITGMSLQLSAILVSAWGKETRKPYN